MILVLHNNYESLRRKIPVPISKNQIDNAFPIFIALFLVLCIFFFWMFLVIIIQICNSCGVLRKCDELEMEKMSSSFMDQGNSSFSQEGFAPNDQYAKDTSQGPIL